MTSPRRVVLLVVLTALATHPRCEGSGHRSFCPQQLAAGVFFGPAPKSAADVEILQRLGVREIVDNRTHRRLASNREAHWALRAGIAYRSLPISTKPCFPDRNLELTLARMHEQPCGAIYVHCSLGRDRTGLIAALYRYRYLGWPPASAFCEKERNEFNSRLVELDSYFWRSVNRGAEVTPSE